MCGICGFVHHKELREKNLLDMNRTIRHRGPDDEGYYLERVIPKFASSTSKTVQIGLAHSRLSILDLSEMGHQPMKSANGDVVVCYNGEIYNYLDIRSELSNNGYRFISNCDTEVIIYAYKEWGIDFVNKMNGMFAISLWDRNLRKFYLIRDRMGVKPLYYFKYTDGLVFASELKPIMAYPFFKKTLNYDAFSEYLYRQYITGPETIFLSVYKLEPGHILEANLSKEGDIAYRDICYWSEEKIYHSLRDNDYISYEECKKSLKESLLDATALRMVSDVPLGFFLSGGYDSSLIAALSKEVSTESIKTFTIGFDEESYDESRDAKAVADYLGADHTCGKCTMESAKSLIENLPLYFDEPMADNSSIACMLLAQTTKEKVTVALSGDAGDELFCGYPKYFFLDKYGKISKGLGTAKKIIPGARGLNANYRLLKLLSSDTISNIVDTDYHIFTRRYEGLIDKIWYNKKYQKNIGISKNTKEQYMLSDMITYLPDDILVKIDRTTMSVSLEARAPFLDYRIVEKAIKMPVEYKCQKFYGKRILKDIVYELIPRELLERPKKGFGVPIGKWLTEDFDGITHGLFDEKYIKKQGLFSKEKINEMKARTKIRPDTNLTQQVWTILMFQLWWDEYMTP